MYKDKLTVDPDDKISQDMLEYYMDFNSRRLEKEADPEWQKDNMEYESEYKTLALKNSATLSFDTNPKIFFPKTSQLLGPNQFHDT